MTSKPLRVITIGKATQDVFLIGKAFTGKRDVRSQDYVEQFPLGAKVLVDQVHFDTGGDASNAAVTFARQGFSVGFAGKVGRDPAGAEAIRVLRHEGVSTHAVAVDETTNTSYSVILLAPNGERTVLNYPGASHQLKSTDFAIRSFVADWFYITSLSGNFELLERLLKQANRHGIEVAFCPGVLELAEPKRLRRLLPMVRVLLANREEYSQLFHGDQPHELLRQAAGLVNYAVLTDGPKGSFATDGASFFTAGQYARVKVVDRLGSGDAFGSGFVARLAAGESIEEALTFASANSTSVVQHLGAKTGILRTGKRLKRLKIRTEPV